MNLLRCWIFLACAWMVGLGGKASADDSPGNEQHGVAGIGIRGGVDVQGASDIHDYIIVLHVIGHSPAQKAGIKAGDEIVQIDGAKVAGMDFKDAMRNHLRGPLGSVVQVTIMRPSDKSQHKFDIVREPVADDAKPAPSGP